MFKLAHTHLSVFRLPQTHLSVFNLAQTRPSVIELVKNRKGGSGSFDELKSNTDTIAIAEVMESENNQSI